MAHFKVPPTVRTPLEFCPSPCDAVVHRVGVDSAGVSNQTDTQMTAIDELRSWVFDEHKPVTYRWLSNELSITSNDAKQLLYQFVRQ